MQWLRLYDDVLDDPKVELLSPKMFRYWVKILCLANKGKPRGRIPNDMHAIAFRLRVRISDAKTIIDELQTRTLLDRDGDYFVPHNWDEWQKKSDSSAERVAAHRARNVTADEPCNVTDLLPVTPPEQIQNRTDTEQNRADTESGADAPLRAKPRKRIPHDWALTDKLRAYAVEWGVPANRVDELAEEFVRYWRSDGRVKADWDLTFMGRVRDVAGRYSARASPNGRHPDPERRPAIPPIEQVLARSKPQRVVEHDLGEW